MQPIWHQLEKRPALALFSIACCITMIRIITLLVSSANLGPDESQYWFWSREPAFGYFSKPPLIAWIIALTTGLFGNTEWAVRLSAPLLHAGTAGFLFLTARQLYGSHTAFWSGVAWLTAPGVILSSFVMATDAPLLFFWSAALYFLIRIDQISMPRIIDVIALGLALGFGVLSKYAMIYFPLAIFFAAALHPPLRPKIPEPSWRTCNYNRTFSDHTQHNMEQHP